MKSYGVSLSLFCLPHLAWYPLDPSMLHTQQDFISYGWVIFHCVYMPHHFCSFIYPVFVLITQLSPKMREASSGDHEPAVSAGIQADARWWLGGDAREEIRIFDEGQDSAWPSLHTLTCLRQLQLWLHRPKNKATRISIQTRTFWE